MRPRSPTDPNARDRLRLTAWLEGLFDNQEQVWFETEGRARVFSCEVNFYGTNYLQGPSGDDQKFSDAKLHSQGGTLRYTRKADGKTYQLRLRDKEYPCYEKRADFMFLSVREGDKPFIAYSLHDPEASFLGMNLGWMSVSCERTDPPQR